MFIIILFLLILMMLLNYILQSNKSSLYIPWPIIMLIPFGLMVSNFTEIKNWDHTITLFNIELFQLAWKNSLNSSLLFLAIGMITWVIVIYDT